jgi:P4 family phage/plasmid primase-like protien|nr:MAG TPA_asm: dsDNA helicase [Caudoviricetes sp.]
MDLKDFHLFTELRDGTFKARDVFDRKIVDYLLEHMDLMIYNNILYIYVDGVYIKDKDGRRIKSQIQALMYEEFKTVIRINRVYNLLMCEYSIVVKEEDLNTFPAHWVNFKNGMYDPIADVLHEHKPEYRAMNQIPHDYIVPEQETELTFCKFLESRLDPDDCTMLYEFIATCMNVDMKFQKFMYIVGTGNAGKSKTLNYINQIVGNENISHIDPQNIGKRFQCAFLIQMLLNSVSDISSKPIEDAKLIKQLTGEDTIQAEYKGGDVFYFHNTSSMIFTANQIPKVSGEDSNGYYRRLLIVRMNDGNYIPNLVESINSELPQFIYFLTRRLHDVYMRGSIFESKGSKSEVKGLRNHSDSVQEFVDMCITESIGMRPKKIDVFNYYEKYCQAEKLDSIGRNDFYESMKAKGFIDGKSCGTWVYKDISITTQNICLG